MSLSPADIKCADVQSFRDVASALDGMATANSDMKSGMGRLPIAGDAWKGLSGDAAHHELDGFGRLLEGSAEAKKGAAAKIRRAADEFEGVKQLLTKIEQDAAKGKFKIDMSTGKVTPPSGDYDKSELDYLTNTLRQIMQAGDAANADLAAAVKAAKELPDPSSSAAAALPTTPTSTVKPGGAFAGVENLVAPKPDGDPGATKAAAAGTDTQANYKDWYPKTTAPGGDKPIDPRQVGGLLGNPAVGDARQEPPKSAPTAPMAPKLNPNNPADKAALDKVRSFLQATVPPDQVESRMAEVIKGVQQDRPMIPAQPEPAPAPGLADGYGNKFKAMGERLLDVTGLNGPDRQVDAVKGTLEGLNHQVALAQNPGLMIADMGKQGIDEAVADWQHPDQIANRTGQHLADATALLATAPFGGEGALARTGLEDASMAGRAGLHDMPGFGGLPHESPHVATPVDHPIPTGGDHGGGGGGGFSGDHSGGVGDHGGGPGGHGMPGGNPTPFDFDNPLQTARPEFNIPNPVDVMSPELRQLSEQHLTGSGETVLGPYRNPINPDGPSYIDVAKQHGASYFDIGKAWDTSTPTQQLAANQHVLDTAIANRDTIRLSIPIDMIKQDTFTGAELRYLQSHGYEIGSDGRSLTPPTKAGG